MRGRDAQAYERFERATEPVMLALALAFLPVVALPLLFELTAAAETALEVMAWCIWAAFAAEYGIKLCLAPDRRQMVRTHVLDLVIILLPFLRPLRALRLLRVVHVGAAAGRAGVAARRLLTRRGFSKFLLAAFSVIVLAGILTWVFERGDAAAEIATPADGVWWALVTSTTVGYGDMVPVTPEGRGIAVLLMLVGIALLSVVTANIAAFFVEEDETGQLGELHGEVVAMREEIARLRLALHAGGDAHGAPPQERRPAAEAGSEPGG